MTRGRPDWARAAGGRSAGDLPGSGRRPARRETARTGRTASRAGRETARARRARLILLLAGMAAGLAALAARCAHLQLVKAPALLDQARSQQERTITLDPRRGPILDRNGKELAVSLDVDSVFADPVEVGDAATAARRLAPLLNLKAADLRERLEGDRRFAWIKRKITPEIRRRVEGLGLQGLGFARESRRYYPKRTLAAHLLGACGVDSQALGGLEFAYDDAVKGTPGQIFFLRDGRGGRVFDETRTEPTAGLGLALSVDEVIQYLVERELDTVMAETSAAGATVVVLRPATGEVLALASRPTFDPNDYASASEEERRNRAVSDYYEPGSTFKILTAAAALDTGRVHPSEVIWCENGSIVVARHRFNEDNLPYGNLTFTEVLAKSSNVGAIKVARRLSAEEFLDYIRRFGFGGRSGIDLPGESPGMLRDLSDWSGLSQASLSMGQEIGVTTLQLASAFGAIANDGIWLRPRVVQATFATGGRRTPAHPDDERVARRAVAPETARTLRRMLQAVVADGGTGKAAAVPGYTVGGKTGTAQKIDSSGRYSPGRHVSWFGGFVPAGSPALVIVVMVDEPKGPKFHGGDIAAPVFARIARPALQYLGVPPDRDGTLVFDRAEQIAERSGSDPAPTKGEAAALRALRRRGDGARKAARRAGGPVPDGIVEASLGGFPAAVRRFGPETATAAAGAPGSAGGMASMPDLTGMSLRQASEMLAAAGVSCTALRSGPRVTRQDPDPGTPLRPGAPCTVVY